MPADRRIVDLREVLDSPQVSQLFVGLSAPAISLLATHEEHGATRVALGMLVDETLVATILARTPHYAICEILATGGDFETFALELTEAAADWFNALAVWAVIDANDVSTWRARGFVCRPDEAGPQWYRAEIRRPPEPDGYHTVARARATDIRRFEIELPPEGNTLPLVPESLRDTEIPPFVVSWILETDEVFLLLQDVLPEIFPPVTPASRPASIRDSLGSLSDVFGDPALDELDGSDQIPGMPGGVRVPVRLLEIAATMERAKAWLVAARRVQSWAASHGAEAESWVEHAIWDVHAVMTPELLMARVDPHGI